MRANRWLSAILLFALTACSAAPSLVPTGGKPTDAARPPVPPAATTAPARAAAAPAAANGAAPTVAGAAPAQAGASKGSDATTTQAAADRPWDRMIVRSATLSLQVESVERALDQVRQIAGKHGGFVASSNTHVERSGDADRTVATLTIQVRADGYDAAMTELRGIATKVDAEVGTSQDVTEEYVDLDANLRNLQATEARLSALMEKAQNLQDVLVIQRELTNVRSQIERIQGRKQFLERRSDFSQITVNLALAATAAAPTPAAGWDPLAPAQRGWAASLRVLRGIADVMILAAAFGWWLVPFLTLAAAVAVRAHLRARAAS